VGASRRPGLSFGGLGPTRYVWTPPVREVNRKVSKRFPAARPNTYIAHPWRGWSRVSVDWWGIGGRGHAIPTETGWSLLHYIMNLPGKPFIRHTIYQHQLWTSYGGYSLWREHDHSGDLRHVHVTYWKEA
jgi:hypothetical protein